MSASVLKKETLLADEGATGERLDLFLSRAIEGVSRKAVKKALDRGQVFVNGRSGCRAGYLLKGGETIMLTIEVPVAAEPEFVCEVLYRDADMLAIAKPPRLPSHPTVEGRPNALDLVRNYLRSEGSSEEPILLHRLDVGTSGLLLFALNREANLSLYRQFCEREVQKTYLALVQGRPPETFEVRNYLKANVRGRTLAVSSGGQFALTDLRRLGQQGDIALMEARPHTGRTHQIRTHLAGEGYPLLGDVLYGGPEIVQIGAERFRVDRALLHACKLELRHPKSNKRLELVSEFPEDFSRLFSRFGLSHSS